MQERPNRLRRAIILALLVIGILGIGFLIYVVVDHLAFDAPVVSVETDPEATSSETPVTEPVGLSTVPIGNRIGQRAPDFRLRSLDGDSVLLSNFLSTVVILDFWASWCGPCRQTMPTLDAIAKSLAADVVLLGVNLDRTEQDAVNYLTSSNFDTMITLYGSYTDALEVFRMYGSGNGIPRTFVIDREGIIRFVGHPARLSLQTVEGLI
ncbi:TlpA family protein disulfide reductase [Candidatus Bipolaricaulota bacterium]